jgi:hypothetical protein
MTAEKQLDRIEKKLDEVLAFRDLLLKLAMPRVPAPLREKAAAVLSGARGGTG